MFYTRYQWFTFLHIFYHEDSFDSMDHFLIRRWKWLANIVCATHNDLYKIGETLRSFDDKCAFLLFTGNLSVSPNVSHITIFTSVFKSLITSHNTVHCAAYFLPDKICVYMKFFCDCKCVHIWLLLYFGSAYQSKRKMVGQYSVFW